jgi:UDP:flavonoid glycosyltransferase YjiC (YdhE family)
LRLDGIGVPRRDYGEAAARLIRRLSYTDFGRLQFLRLGTAQQCGGRLAMTLSGSLWRMRAVVMTWAPGGNLPPLLAVASLLRRREHEVVILASGATRAAARQLGFEVTGYRRSPDPDVEVAFEAQAQAVMARLAGAEIADDARDALTELQPDVAIVDCMMPAAISAARASGTPAVSVVHFLYGLARTQMLRAGGGWTTDLRSLAATHRRLGLPPPDDGVGAWEAAGLLLVTAPRWLDVDCDAPANVLYAGPLGVAARPRAPKGERPRVLLTFSSTVMGGQVALIERACEAVAGLEDVEAVMTLGPAVARDAVRIPEGVTVMGVADHDRLMPGAAAVIGHGGLGTVLRALAHGVPQLVLPLGRDQAFNAGRVEQLGAGIEVSADAGPPRIRRAVDALLGDERYQAAATLAARRIAADEPDRAAAEALERLVGG